MGTGPHVSPEGAEHQVEQSRTVDLTRGGQSRMVVKPGRSGGLVEMLVGLRVLGWGLGNKIDNGLVYVTIKGQSLCKGLL